MDWAQREKAARRCCQLINDAAREMDRIEVIRRGVMARTELAALVRELAELQDPTEFPQILGVMQLKAEYEQESARIQPDYFASASAAVDQLAVGATTLGWLLHHPEIYKAYVVPLHAAKKYQDKDGLPEDRMREALKAHASRITNASAGRASSPDQAELYAALLALIHHLQALYTRLLRQTLA